MDWWNNREEIKVDGFDKAKKYTAEKIAVRLTFAAITDPDGAERTYTRSISRNPEGVATAETAVASDEEPDDVTAYVRVGDLRIVTAFPSTTAVVSGRLLQRAAAQERVDRGL